MTLGELRFDLEAQQDVLDLLVKGQHLLLYEGERHVHTAVILRRNPSDKTPSVTGRELEWWLGDPNAGPLINSREYVAGNNKLLDPDFTLGDLHWKIAQDSAWALSTGQAAVTVDNNTDDVLEVNETYDVRDGQHHHIAVLVHRAGGSLVGQLRLRALYQGRFTAFDQLAANGIDGTFENGGIGWTNASEFPGDAAIVNDPTHARNGNWVMRVGPTTRKQLLHNTGFESFDYWVPDVITELGNAFTLSADYAFTGSGFAGTKSARAPDPADTGGDGYYLVEMASDDDLVASVTGINVLPNEKYRTTVWFLAPAGTDIDDTYMASTQVQCRSFPSDFDTWFEQTPLASRALINQGWQPIITEFEVPQLEPGDEHLAIALRIKALVARTTGHVYVGYATVERLIGNSCIQTANTFSQIIPLRTYQLRAFVKSDVGVTGDGGVNFVARMMGLNRTDVVLESAPVQGTGGEWHQFVMDVTPPSGYDAISVSVKGVDIEGGSFWVEDITLVDTDNTTLVDDGFVTAPIATDTVISSETYATAGAETMKLQIVAESGSSGWQLHHASIARAGEPIATVGEIFRDLLKDPDTGAPLLLAGEVNGDDAILHDWRIENTYQRDALRTLVGGGVCEPLREYRVNPDFTVDLGTAEELYEIHDDMVFVDEDLKLLRQPELEESAEAYASQIKLIGADRKTATGGTEKITATAPVPNDVPMLDPWGRPANRSHVVQDGTVDHTAFAALAAGYAAMQAAKAAHSTGVTASDLRVWANIATGDWVFVYKPSAGLVDLANERTTDDGKVVFPEKIRLIARTKKLGPGFKLFVRPPDGSEPIEITSAVKWEPTTTEELTLGSLAPTFSVDPQGGSAFDQFRAFVKFRASAR